MKRFPGTPQSKAIGVNDKFGNFGIKEQQGTTRIIYDALPLVAGRTTYEFFKNCKTRLFPFTNLPENKLQVGETIVIQSYYMFLILVDTNKNNEVTKIAQLSSFEATRPIYRSDFDLLIGENRVLKQVSVTSAAAPFNVDANFAINSLLSSSTTGTDPIVTTNTNSGTTHDVYNLKTDLVIPPGIEFWVNFTQGGGSIPTAGDGLVWYLGMSIEGVGSIVAPRTTF